jgi:Flp pilus assembly pilin Flp
VKVLRRLKTFFGDEQGATAIEYALIAATMATMLIPTLSLTSSGITSLYTKIVELFQHESVTF